MRVPPWGNTDVSHAFRFACNPENGLVDVTSFSIVCTMRFQTSRPRPPNFNVYIEATSHMCPVLRQTLKLREGGGF